MGKVCWDFPLLGTGNQSGNNIAAITMFKGSGIMDGLAREVCQNSLDAKDKELSPEVPVKVKFELVNIQKKDYSLFDGYQEALDSSIDFWKTSPLSTPKIMEFLQNVKNALICDEIPVLVMSDYNTVGLNGVNATGSEKSFWNLLVNTEGISIKQDESSAGSFGIGKNAPFAYSALNLVFYNTLAKDGGRAFEGVTRLVTTQKAYNGTLRPTQPIGKYLYLEDEYTGRPILPEDHCDIAEIEIFKREEVGTDVAVFGFKKDDYNDWENLTAVAIIKNFIMAIMEGKLEVTIKSPDVEREISKDTVEALLFNTFAEEPQLKYARQTYDTIKTGILKNTKIAEDDDLSIYVKYDDKYSASLSRFRSTGMLINTTVDVLPHFSIVIVVNDVGEKELSKTLREAEPPQHTEWKAKNITDNRELHNKAARFIRQITKEIQKVLDEFEKADIAEKMDAGIGDYLPDSSDSSGAGEGNDGLKTDLKINEIAKTDGRVLFKNQYESAASSEGKKTPDDAGKVGDRRGRKRDKRKIVVVTPGAGGNKGVSTGNGKVRKAAPIITEHRTFRKIANIYQCYINVPVDYDKVVISYYASRDDEKRDPLVIKSYKKENGVSIKVNAKELGPISLKAGSNILYVEFENNEIMAVMPVFSLEVSNEKQSD